MEDTAKGKGRWLGEDQFIPQHQFNLWGPAAMASDRRLLQAQGNLLITRPAAHLVLQPSVTHQLPMPMPLLTTPQG